MGENPVAKFRRVFAAQLQSTKPAPGDVAQAVGALSTSKQLVESLDVYCALYDPDKPQKTRAAYELCRSAGHNLFSRCLDLATPENELAELVNAMADAQVKLKDATLAKHAATYRARFVTLEKKEQELFNRRALKVMQDRATEAKKRRFLLDELEKAYQNQNGHLPTKDELAWFDPGPQTSRKEFERLAIACAVAWSPKSGGTAGVWVSEQFIQTPGAKPQTQTSSAAATTNVHNAFAAFAGFVEAQINRPLDLFRLLAWASEPKNPYLTLRVNNAREIPVASRAWSNVWQELYQDIAVRGFQVAVSRWNIDRMHQAKGYVGKDLDYILAPLSQHERDLLKRRIADYFKGVPAFIAAQDGRRRAKVWGDMKHLAIVDELESEAFLKDMIKEFEADTKAVLSRKVHVQSRKVVFQGKYSIYQTVEDTFTVVWIPRNALGRFAYVEVLAIPGVIFKAWGDRVGLEDLIEDKVYSDLAANAAALTQFLLAYLQLLGYVVDVITAGASGGLRVIVLRFIEERIKDKLVSETLDLVGVDNPWVTALFGMAAGFVPSAIHAPKVGAVKGLEQIEHEAQTVTRGGSRFKPKAGVGDPVPKVRSGAPPVADVPPPKIAPLSVGPGTEVVTDNVFAIGKASAAETAAYVARMTKGTPKVPGRIDRLKDYVVGKVERATEAVAAHAMQPAVAGRAEGGAEHAVAGGMMATRLPTSGVSPGVAGGRGTQRVTQAATGASKRLQQSSQFKMLLEYETTVMASWEVKASRERRDAIIAALERGPGNRAAEEEAFSQLTGALNKAKSDAGEFLLGADMHSNFDVLDFVSVPRRENGVPVLDVVVKLRKNSKLNGGKRFGFGEAKGGLNTGLGEVTAKRYLFVDGELRFVPQTRRSAIRQGSGEWYYQKLAETFALGQKVGGKDGPKWRALALEMFDAATKGEITTLVGKSNLQLERKFIDTTAEVVAYFKSIKWDMSKGFPIPR